MPRRALFLVAVIALLNAGAFIAYQWPDHATDWTDQGGYQRLGAALAETGKFTRYPDSPVFVPEVIRTPGYPAFVAAVYAVFGTGNDLAVAGAQAVVFAGIALLVFAVARRVTTPGIATAAAVVTALFPTLPYFGALVLTELWATFMVTLAMLVTVHAAQKGRLRDFALAGILLGCATLVRPVFVLLPFFMALGVPILVRGQRTRPRLLGWATVMVCACLALLPWFTYNYVNLGQFTLSPAGGVGRGLWEGTWQGRWPGRLHNELTELADATPDDAALDRRVRALASEAGADAGPMLDYVHEWRDIRRIWDTPQDPLERARARVVADQTYLRAALAHIAADPLGHAWRRVTRGIFVLWAADIPIRYSDINGTPPLVIRAIWLAQVGLLLLAAWGLLTLVRRGQWLEAVLLGLPLVYVTGVHVPLLCEARQSLPVKPLVIVLATIGAASFAGRRVA